jgi:hypothetical protein
MSNFKTRDNILAIMEENPNNIQDNVYLRICNELKNIKENDTEMYGDPLLEIQYESLRLEMQGLQLMYKMSQDYADYANKKIERLEEALKAAKTIAAPVVVVKKAVKAVKAEKIINPRTGRLVLKDGKIGKQVIAMQQQQNNVAT